MKLNTCSFYITQTSTLLTLLVSQPATAQIIPDNTVNTTVTPNGNINVIEGGTRAGNNLFHSFQEFSIPTGREAFFNNGLDIQNIFSRVTGRTISNIDGLIRANGVANLFLLNPNGIIFGPNARLNIGGSFLATTANSFKFADGIEFSATNPQAAPLLSVNVPIGLQMGLNPGNITVNGTGLNRFVPIEGETTEERAARLIAFEQNFLNNPQGLFVQPGKTIGLVGGNLTFNGGIVGVRQGRIELGSVNSGEVSLNPTEAGLVLGYDNVSNFGEIQMSQSSAVAASGEGAGEIRVRGGKITLNERSSIGANTIGNENGKSVTVEAQQLSLFDGSFLTSGTFSLGDAGNLIVKATESVEVSGFSTENKFSSSLQTVTLAGGKAGNLTIETGRLIIKDGAFVSTETRGTGNGGNLLVQAKDSVEILGTQPNGFPTFLSAGVGAGKTSTGTGGNLIIETGTLSIRDGGRASTETFGRGNAGNLLVKARELLEVVGEGPITSQFPVGISSSLNSDVSSGAVGNGGNLTIETQKLSVRDGGQVSTSVYGQGKGGMLQVQASELVEVVGAGRINKSENGTEIRNSSGINATVLINGVGSGGEININTQNLSLRDGGRISTGTLGKGNAGNIQIQASKSVEILGSAKFGNLSDISTSVLQKAEGKGGNIRIDTEVLSLRDGGEISAGTFGMGDSGNIYIRATEAVEIIGKSTDRKIPSASGLAAPVLSDAKGNGGNITVETKRLTLNEGDIFVATNGDGNAGNIFLQVSELVELSNNSIIGAGTLGKATGNSGKIIIETGRLQLADNSFISTFSNNQGGGGTVIVRAEESVQMNSNSDISAAANSTGDGGDIIIETQRLVIRDGSLAAVDTFAAGKAGNLTVKASEIEIDRENGEFATGLSVSSNDEGTGDAGNLSIETGRLIVRNGAQIQAGTFSSGKGGNLTVIAQEIELSGVSDELLPAGLFVSTEGTGDAGNLRIETGRLIVRDGAQIQAATTGAGKGGSLSVIANEIELQRGNSPYSTGLFTSTKGHSDAGNVSIETERLIVRNGAAIQAVTFGAGKGGSLSVKANTVEIIGFSVNGNSSSFSAGTEGTGEGGNLTIETKQLTVRDGAQISVSTFGAGNAGSLTVKADVVEVIGISADGQFSSGLFASTEGTGNAGNLTIETKQLTVRDGAQILASTFGAGNAGDLMVEADLVEVIGTSADGQFSSGLYSNTFGTGDGGNLTIETKQLTVQAGAAISVTTFDAGKAGNLIINADLVKAIGISADGLYPTGLFADTNGTGNAGNLTINARSVIVRDGAQVAASTFDAGKAGDLQITAEFVEVAEKAVNGKSSGLFVTAESGSGDAGNLIINSERLIVRDGARVTASSFGTGAAGNLEVTANSVLIDNEGILRATIAAGSQGNINLQTSSLIMRRGSSITTNATGEATGGNIIINTDVLAALENSDISANAEDSFGGRVIINSQGIFGTKFRPDNTPESDITATSKLGPQFSGSVQINTPEVDPNSGLVNLPDNAVDVSRLVPKGCIARRKETGTFYITGNGGFQYRPGDGLISPLPTGEVRSIPEDNSSERSDVNGRIIEAQGIYKLENGQMVLGWECPE